MTTKTTVTHPCIVPLDNRFGLAFPDKGTPEYLNKNNRDKLFDTIISTFTGTTVKKYLCERDTDYHWIEQGDIAISEIKKSSSEKLLNPYNDIHTLELHGVSMRNATPYLFQIQADGRKGGNSHKIAIYRKNNSDWLYVLDTLHFDIIGMYSATLLKKV